MSKISIPKTTIRSICSGCKCAKLFIHYILSRCHLDVFIFSGDNIYMRYLILILLIAAGTLALSQTFKIVGFFGHMDWAERYLGPGGSYLAWRILGVALIVGAIYGINVGWY